MSIKLKEKKLMKYDHRELDYQKLTFKDFIIIQNKAKEVANNIGYPVYLVGSSLNNPNPRDIDISIIIPHDRYVEIFDIDIEYCNKYDSCLDIAYNRCVELIYPLTSLSYNIDLKICPDNWWNDKEKILLAEPEIVLGEVIPLEEFNPDEIIWGSLELDKSHREIIIWGSLELDKNHREYIRSLNKDLVIDCLYSYIGKLVGSIYGTVIRTNFNDYSIDIPTNGNYLLRISYSNAKKIVDELKDTKKIRKRYG